jgi:hypothetical protein
MNTRKKIIFFLFIGISLSFCAQKPKNQTKFPQEFASVYSEHWVGGVRGSGGGIHLHIEFKKPLSSDIQLEKVYFQNLEAKVERQSQTVFVANFVKKYNNPDLILEDDSNKEYGNKGPEIQKPRFNLKPNEAMLEYRKKNKILFFKIRNIKEKPMIAYP